MRKTLTVILAVVAVVALSMLSTFAYEHWLSNRHRHERHDAGHPFALLRGELALTKEQMTRLEAGRKEFEGELKEERAQLREKRTALMEALRAEAPDTSVIDRLTEEIGAVQIVLEKRMIRHMLREETILTPEQRQRLHSLFRKHMNRRKDMPWAGPEGGPMDEMGPGPDRGRGPGHGPGMMGHGQFPPPDSARGMGPGMMAPGQNPAPPPRGGTGSR